MEQLKILMVMSHPDDEIIFGWPILQNRNLSASILMCSTDETSKERSWCSHRRRPLERLCKEESINLDLLKGYNSNFYKLDSRKGSLLKLLSQISDYIRSFECDFIFTHNPYGEYGHLDHKLIFDQVLRASNKPILYTDIHMELESWPSKSYNDNIKNLFYNKERLFKKDLELDLINYKKWETEYRSQNVWTWSKAPVEKCNLYKI